MAGSLRYRGNFNQRCSACPAIDGASNPVTTCGRSISLQSCNILSRSDKRRGIYLSRLNSSEVRGTINNQGFTVLLKHLLLQNGDGGRPRVTSENAKARIRRQPRIGIADGCEKVRINLRVPDAVGGLGYGLPHLLQLGFGYVVATNVAVKGRLLRGAAELDHDGMYFLCKVGMTNYSDSQIGIQFPSVGLA